MGERKMKTVGVREFRDSMAEYLMSDTPLAITRHGQTVGFYIPRRRRPTEEDLAALREAVTRVQETLAEYGISEDEVIREFDERRRAAHKVHSR